MCGIVGYIGPRSATAVILAGLERLEYRGYDSAGLAVIQGNQVQRRRAPGKLERLVAAVTAAPLDGRIGIGHTRWATHGKPSEQNAHPHTDCHGDLVVIHNGIVENYLDLKAELEEHDHTFASETDTEVLAHLIEQAYREMSDPLNLPSRLLAATMQALTRIQGAHAIVVMSRHEPDTLVAARLGNAGGVVIGLGQGETFVTSDLPAILPYTRTVLFLEDREVALIRADSVTIWPLDRDPKAGPVARSPQQINWDPVAAAKGGYKHFMLKEIYEQPRSIADTLAGRLRPESGEVILKDVNLSPSAIQDLRKITIVACGTAWHASLVGKFLIEALARIPVEVDYASEFRYREPVVDPHPLLVAVTQSGETVDTLAAMELAGRMGTHRLGIVNVVGSQASRVAESVIYTHAGPEIGVASTKAFTAQLTALYLLSIYLGHTRRTLDRHAAQAHIHDLAQLPDLVGRTLALDNNYEGLAHRFYKAEHFLYLGRGIQYPIALEGALKLKEISYVHAEGYPAGEMKHGPIALIDEAMPVVALAPRNPVYDKMLSNIEQVKARDGIVIAVAEENDPVIAAKADYVLRVPAASPFLSPILTAIPLQLLAYHVAVRRGCDVDQPRNLAKSVTVE